MGVSMMLGGGVGARRTNLKKGSAAERLTDYLNYILGECSSDVVRVVLLPLLGHTIATTPVVFYIATTIGIPQSFVLVAHLIPRLPKNSARGMVFGQA